jgi:hypothetical protein
MFRKLPKFKDYTVDEKLKQFRKVELDELPEFIDFDSDKGQVLLAEYEEQ